MWESKAHPIPWLIALQPATADLGSLQQGLCTLRLAPSLLTLWASLGTWTFP